MTDDIDVEEVVQVLKSEYKTTEDRIEALETLSEYSLEEASAVIPYLDVIAPFANHEEHTIRRAVAFILWGAASHDPSAIVPHVGAVYTQLVDDNPSVLVRATSAAMHLSTESPTALLAATDRLFELLTYENAGAPGPARDIRGKAATTLGYLGEIDPIVAARAGEPLAERLDDHESDVRGATVLAVMQLGFAHPETVSTALDRLPGRLDDEDADVRRNAIRAFVLFQREEPSLIKRPEAVAPALERAALDSTEASGVDEACEYIEGIIENEEYVMTEQSNKQPT